MVSLGSRIKRQRELLGLSQEELAKKMGYKSRSSINKIELDINDISQSKIMALAQILKTTPAYIMGWEQNDNAVKEINKPEILYLYDKLDIEDRAEIRGTMKQMLKADKYKQDIHIVPNRKSYSDIYTQSEDDDDDDDVRIAAHKKVSIPPIIDDEGYHT